MAFDGVTSLSKEAFLAIIDTTLPRPSAAPFDAWPFAPRLQLVLFVHRVDGLDPGLYLWLRAPANEDALRLAFHGKLNWEAVTDSVSTAPLYRLGRGDLRDFARTLSCHQAIAADSAFSLGVLSLFEDSLAEEVLTGRIKEGDSAEVDIDHDKKVVVRHLNTSTPVTPQLANAGI